MSTHISTAMPAPAWDSITKSEDYQSMTPADQAEIKSKYFHNFIAPKISTKIANDPELKAGGMTAAYQEWMRRPDDSGQGYITSGLSSVARGATSVIPNTVSGLGYVLDSESLIGAGEDIQQGLNAALPVNPALENTFGMKALNAVGQAVGIMATGATSAAAFGVNTAGKAVMGYTALAGANEGGQNADRLGVTGVDKAAMIAIGAATETASEMMFYGTGPQTYLANRLFGGTPSVKPSLLMPFGEGVEEIAANMGHNASNKYFAPPGVETPDITHGNLEAGALGVIGGATFVGAGMVGQRLNDQYSPLPPTETPPTGTTEPAAKLQYDTRGNLLNPLTPQQAAPINVQFNGMTFHRDATGAWGQVNENPAPGTLPVTLLDPLNGTEGHLITQLDDIADRELRLKKPAAEAPHIAVASQNADTRETTHRVFEGGSPIRRTGAGVMEANNPNMAFRLTGMPQIEDIINTGVVRSKEGKIKGGRQGEVHWSRGHESLGFSPAQNMYVLQTSADNLNNRKGGLPVSDVTVWKAQNGQWVDVTKDIQNRIKTTTLLVQPTVLTAEDTPPATMNNQLGAPAAPTVTHMKPAAAGEVQHASQLAEQFKPGNMVSMKSGEGDAVVQSVNPDHTVTINREDGTTDTVQPDAISMLPPESKSPSQGGIYTAVQIGGKVITTPGVHYDAVLNHTIREDLPPMEKDGLDAQQIKELADRKLVEKGPQWLRDHVVEGFVIGGQFYNRVQAKQKLNDMGIETPLAEQEQRDWLDSADIQNPADLMSPAEYDAMQEKNEALLESVGLPSKPGTQLWATQLIKNALARMAHDTELPATTRLVAEALAKLNMPQILFSVTADARGTYAGLYTPRSWDGTRGGVGEISINTRVKGRGEGDARYTLIHEVLHHATTWLRHNPKTAFDKQQVENLERLRKRAQAYAASLGDVATKNHPAREFSYEFSNVDEFITGLFTRADFQQFLASIPVEHTPSLVGRVRSVLQELFRTIAKLVTGGEVEKGSLLDESFGAALNLMHGEDVARGNLPPPSGLPPALMSPADDYRFSRLEREQEFVPRNADGSLQKLKDTFKYVNSVEQNRTIEGKPIEQVLAYVPRRDELMEPAVMEVLDDLVRANASATDILKIITSGTQPGSNVHIEADERAIFTRWMLNSGRWRDFEGLTEDKVIAAFESLASQFGYLGQQWQAILDPMTKLKDEATVKTGEAFKAETGEDIKGAWAELQKQIDALKGTIKQLLGKGVQGVEDSDVVKAEQAIDESFRGKLARDGAQRIADAFFFSRDNNDTDVGPLVEGADMVKGELTKLLNESLDRMGINKVQPDKPKQDEFQRIAVALGLDDVRSDKLKEIDRRVRERVAEMLEAGEIDESLAEMLISQWETSSSAMLNTSVSGSTARRVFKQVMKDNDVSMSDLLGLSAKERTRAIREIAHEVASRVAKAGSTKDLTNLRKVVEAAGHQIVSSAEQQREKLKARMKDNQDVAEDIIAAFEKKFAGIPSFAPQKKGIRKLVDDAIHAREIMPDFVERAMALGVDELTAKTLGDMTLEHGRRKAAEREERERKQAEERRKAKIETTIKRLLGTSKKSTERTSRFIGNLLRADELGILDSKVFADAFATAFNLNNLTPAVVRKLRDNWREITRLGPDGLPVWRGIPRETLERRFIEAVNAVSPGARLGNVIFDQYQASALATVGSIINQFSGLFRGLFGVDAFSRSFSRGDVLGTAQEWWKNMSDMFGNLPLMLTGVQGESLGHGRSELKSTFTPGEQKLALTGDGQQFRILHKDGSVTMMPENWRKVLRLKELWTWRTIRAAEAVSGVTDSQAWFRQVLALHYQKQGMSAAEARRRSFEDTAGTEEERASATEQAQRERDAGLLAANDKAQFNRRVQEIINERIETKLGTNLISRVEYLTAASQFKTVPTGVLGYPIYRMFNMLSKSQNPIGKAAKFFFLFGRFLGHTVDTMMAYTPGLSVATLARDSSDSARTKLIREIYGDTATYNQQQHGKHAAGAAFLLVNGMLMALAQAMADDDEEPFYQIFGSAPGASRDQKEALQAAGKWKEGVVRLFGMNISYNQIPELAPLFSLLGNASDYARFGQQLYSEKGKQLPMGEAAVMSIQDVLLSPVKRSTYKQWVDAVGKAMSGEKSDAFANIVTQPVGTALRLPIVADLDKLFRQMEGSQDAKGYGQNLLRRIPFVAVGDHMFNGYGEQLPSLGVISMFPPDAQVPEEVKKAAALNVETGTVRALPKDPQLKDDRELTSEEREQFVKRSGHYFVESLLRNQESVRRAYKTGGREAAQKVVSNISSKANERAKKELGLLKK